MRLDEEHADAVREITNVAMGQAAELLARTLDKYVHLSIPAVYVVKAERLIDAVAPLNWAKRDVTLVREAFFGSLRGEALTLLELDGGGHDVLGEGAGLSANELALEIANMLTGACLDSIAAQLGYDVGYSPPQVIGQGQAAETALTATRHGPQSELLIIAFDLTVDASVFTSRVVLVLSADAALHFTAAVDRFLAAVSQ